MSNTFITPTLIAKTAISTLYNRLVLAPLVWRDFDSDFAGKQGATVNARKPAVFTAESFDRTKGITKQAIDEDYIPITLDEIANVSVVVTDEELTLDIADFAGQILTPAMEAIAQKVDGDLAEDLVDNAGTASQLVSIGSNDANYVFRHAYSTLSRNKYPNGNRYIVVSPEANAESLGDPLFVQANKSGSTDALRQANIGHVFGFDTYESQVFGVGAGNKGSADGVAFHQSAVTLAVRPLLAPNGVAPNQVSVDNYKGLSLRTVYAYDATYKQDVLSIDLLYGIADTRADGVVELDFGQGS